MFLFNDNLFDNVFDGFKGASEVIRSNISMRADVLENEDAYLVQMEVAGVAKENISIEYDDNTLAITVKKGETKEDKEFKVLQSERYQAYGKREFYLEHINQDEIKAKCENGVLEIVCPKRKPEPKEVKLIEIK